MITIFRDMKIQRMKQEKLEDKGTCKEPSQISSSLLGIGRMDIDSEKNIINGFFGITIQQIDKNNEISPQSPF